ncbi:hypothetical protein SAMN05444380_11578 [Thermophagus xiamenensis]|uniref:Uncharacterized protein n=1 Tax=Thermophagus xiamenensis TaxID=385682 RepID=A0A1I2CAQ6_9BACT|nr:hypothetical protein SAMN05444380_11578 [Thermophagus xiamenensis]
MIKKERKQDLLQSNHSGIEMVDIPEEDITEWELQSNHSGIEMLVFG